jgi:hypothetical protein
MKMQTYVRGRKFRGIQMVRIGFNIALRRTYLNFLPVAKIKKSCWQSPFTKMGYIELK